MPELDFAAIDVETANGKRESACAVGVTVVRNGQLQSSDSWLIKPLPSADHFERRNTALHGITREQCMADGLPWPETAQRLDRLCADLPVMAHNASFDESVWRAANRASGVEAPLPRFHCTLQLSRGHLDLVDHKLPTVVRHLGLDDFAHHQAEADALAAAQVTLERAETGVRVEDDVDPHAVLDDATPVGSGVPDTTTDARELEVRRPGEFHLGAGG